MTIPVSKLRKPVSTQRDDAREREERAPAAARESLRPLMRRDIDRRIERLTGEVASSLLTESGALHEFTTPRPQWVTAKDFTDRLRPFLVYN